MDAALRWIKKCIPSRFFKLMQPPYHYALAWAGALWYGFPSRALRVVGVTGTKGKTSTIEILNAILEEAGYRTAVVSTLRFKIGSSEERNLLKMTMPGRFELQRLLRRAVEERCDFAIVEMTSEGARLFRHAFIRLDAFVFTNIAPEHLESHGSFEKYLAAKLTLARALEQSPKRPRVLAVNKDDRYAERFLAVRAEIRRAFSLADAAPYALTNDGLEFTLRGRRMAAHLRGLPNLSNILAAAAIAEAFGVGDEIIARALENLRGIRGRLERVESGQDFEVIVDYAHTPDSLEKLYQVFENRRKICVLGGTGGGRDKWKRPEMGRIAERYCDEILLTDEDPYDEDPRAIVADIQKGVPSKSARVLMDRRAAIREALSLARAGDAVLITGKGTDPYIMGPRGTKVPWDDAVVAREELAKLLEGK